MTVTNATQAVEVAVTNPAPYARPGVAAVPWSDVRAYAPSLSYDAVEVIYHGIRVPSQVDAVEKSGASRTLIFSLPLPAGDEHYRDPTTRVVVRAAEDPPRPPHAQIAEDTGNGVRLANGVLDVWFSTKARPWNDERTWFAGAASTVQIKKREFLDANAGFAWEGHDREKRAMQIDRVRIWRPPWDEYEPAYCDFPMHDRDFELIACGAGPVRAWCTIASTPFDFDFRDLSESRRRAYNCRLYRTISLFADSDFLFEELHIQATPAGFDGPGKLAFAARYFMSAHLGLLPEIRRVPRIPDWFGIGSDMPPFLGYGFATDAHATACSNPPPDFPRPHEEHKGFEWETAAARTIRSVHLFQLDVSPADIADAAGKTWYLQLLKPLRAHVVGEWREERS